MRKDGDLQVWWIPQVPGTMFTVDVASVAEEAREMVRQIAAGVEPHSQGVVSKESP